MRLQDGQAAVNHTHVVLEAGAFPASSKTQASPLAGLGSVGEHVAHHAHVPVTIVPPITPVEEMITVRGARVGGKGRSEVLGWNFLVKRLCCHVLATLLSQHFSDFRFVSSLTDRVVHRPSLIPVVFPVNVSFDVCHHGIRIQEPRALREVWVFPGLRDKSESASMCFSHS